MCLAEFDEAAFKKGAREEGLEEGRIEEHIMNVIVNFDSCKIN